MTNNILFVTIALTLTAGYADIQIYPLPPPIIVEANFDEQYEGNMDSKIDYIFTYRKINFQNIFLQETRVIVESNATFNFPLTVVVNQKTQVLSWQIPFSKNSNYSSASRTLCSTNNSINNEKSIMITLSTTSSSAISYRLKLLSVEEPHIRIGEVKSDIKVTPPEPVYYSYSFNENSESKSVIVQLESDSEVCMILSIQNKSCPILEAENFKYANYWQTVLRQGAITVSKDNFPDGFIIVLIVKNDDSMCFGTFGERPSKDFLSQTQRAKFATLFIKPGQINDNYIFACTLFASIVIGFAIVYALSTLFYYKNCKYAKYTLNHEEECGINLNDEATEVCLRENLISNKRINKNLVVYVCDMAQEKLKDLKERSQLYLYYLVTVAVFYILPVLQLVATNQINVQESGNQDLCYYNFLCAQPFRFLSSFNNIFSNFGYTLFGTLFIIIARLREKYNTLNRQTMLGIPQHYGLYYAMGIALIMQGVLSSCYHFCPSRNNFQFDTSFMYVIAVICLVKLFQMRHPDILPKAPVTFAILSLTIFLGLIGVLDGSPLFWIIFTVIHLTFFFYLFTEVYSLGKRKFIGGRCRALIFTMKQDISKIREDYFTPTVVIKFIFVILSVGSNIGLAIYSNFFRNKDFAMYLLSILLMNLVLYLCFYCFMKFCENEKILVQPSIFIILSILFWFGAFNFYLRRTTAWDLTPAQSRNHNKPCIFFNFFDSHDVWHFLSSLAMFFSFMILLTIDDDLQNVPRSKIPVF